MILFIPDLPSVNTINEVNKTEIMVSTQIKTIDMQNCFDYHILINNNQYEPFVGTNISTDNYPLFYYPQFNSEEIYTENFDIVAKFPKFNSYKTKVKLKSISNFIPNSFL